MPVIPFFLLDEADFSELEIARHYFICVCVFFFFPPSLRAVTVSTACFCSDSLVQCKRLHSPLWFQENIAFGKELFPRCLASLELAIGSHSGGYFTNGEAEVASGVHLAIIVRVRDRLFSVS